MGKKMIFVLLLFLLQISVFSDASGEPGYLPSSPEQEGKILLDTIISGFKAVAVAGDGGYRTVDELLQLSMARLRKARETQVVDSVFYRRYKRILEVLKLCIMDFTVDREGILSDHIARELQDFVYDITGESKDMSMPKSRGIASISEAVTFELLNLHIYLDTIENRPELIKKYFNVPPPPPPRNKKKDR